MSLQLVAHRLNAGIERGVDADGNSGAHQLFPGLPRAIVGRLRNRGRRARGKAQRARARQRLAAIDVDPTHRIDLQPGIAAADEQTIQRQEHLAQWGDPKGPSGRRRVCDETQRNTPIENTATLTLTETPAYS